MTGMFSNCEWLSTQVELSKFLLLNEYKNYEVPGMLRVEETHIPTCVHAQQNHLVPTNLHPGQLTHWPDCSEAKQSYLGNSKGKCKHKQRQVYQEPQCYYRMLSK